MRRFLISFLVLATILISSCKKEVLPDATLTEDEVARDYLYEVMNSYYLWYKLMPAVKKEDNKDPYELLEGMRYKELDKWSNIQDYDEYIEQSKGSFVGHGIKIGLDATNKTRIAQIYKNSPLYRKGVRRGWIIKKLNNVDLAPFFINRDGAGYNALIGPMEEGIPNTFLFQMPDGRDSTITTIKSTFILNTVIHYDTLKLKSGITGYLVFDQFISPSNQELETAFEYFKRLNITDLILDLRYNSGGDLNVVPNLGGYIAGTSKFGKPFLKMTWNDQNSSKNITWNFNAVNYPLALSRLITICTRSTASASEDLINGLKPFLDVVIIGDTTHGKPVGMKGFNHNNKYMYWPITFTLVNAEEKGDFYKGFYPKKYVPDDITHDWNNRNELCLKEAIYYLENGTVSAKSAYSYKPSIYFSEKPDRMNNAYLVEENIVNR